MRLRHFFVAIGVVALLISCDALATDSPPAGEGGRLSLSLQAELITAGGPRLYVEPTTTLTISASDSDLTAGETATITFTFSRAATGFTNDDVLGSWAGTLGAISTADEGVTYTSTFTPNAGTDGTATFSVADDSYTDADGNNGTGDSLNVELSTNTPTLLITTSDADLAAGETATITFNFSEAATGFTVEDIIVSGGTLGAISTADEGVTYTSTFTPEAGTDGTATFSVADDSYTDADGNNGTGDSLNIELSTVPVYSVSGQVNYGVTPLSGVTVELRSGSSTGPVMATDTTGVDGSYVFPSVPLGTSYWVRLNAPSDDYVNWRAGNLTVEDEDVDRGTHYLPKVIALSPPGYPSPADGETVTTSYDWIRLDWEGNPEAADYQVQINVTDGWELIEQVWTNSLYPSYNAGSGGSLTDVAAQFESGVTYSWSVRAIDSEGNEVGDSEASYTFTIETP